MTGSSPKNLVIPFHNSYSEYFCVLMLTTYLCILCISNFFWHRWPSWSGMWTRWPPSSVCSVSVVIHTLKYTVFTHLYLYLYLLPRYVLPHVLRFRQPRMRSPVSLEDSHVETTVQILSLVSWWKWLYGCIIWYIYGIWYYMVVLSSLLYLK